MDVMDTTSLLRCSLCSRDFVRQELRVSPVPGHANSHLCRMCWAVLCTQSWPADDTAHGGQHLSQTATGAQIHNHKTPISQEQLLLQQEHHNKKDFAQRRSVSMANFASSGMAVPYPHRNHNFAATGRHPASMPEQHITLGGSGSADPRWNVLASSVDPRYPTHQRYSQQCDHQLQRTGSAPTWRDINSPTGGTNSYLQYPPTFSPVELKNMMDEESLELFESQSHLLDPESRQALERQRQYLQWQNSVDEPGPMQSVLERQDSAGSGCAPLVDDDVGDGEGRQHGGMHSPFHSHQQLLQLQQQQGVDEHGNINKQVDSLRKRSSSGDGGGNNTAVGGLLAGGEDGSVHGGRSRNGDAVVAIQELQNAKRQIATLSKEREELLIKVQQLESELQTQREAVLCKMCRQTLRNCVVLPCLHFTTCESCFKKHCGGSSVSCPSCNIKCTGFQTLLLL